MQDNATHTSHLPNVSKAVKVSTSSPILLSSLHSTMALEIDDRGAAISYWGPHLHNDAAYQQIAKARRRPLLTQGLAVDPPIHLCPSAALGFNGTPGVTATGTNNAWGIDFKVIEVIHEVPSLVVLKLQDSYRKLNLIQKITVDAATGVFIFSTEFINNSDAPIVLQWCNAACIPLSQDLQDILAFEGTWAKEFQLTRTRRSRGVFSRENRRGRTSHDNFPGVIVCAPETTELSGPALAFHLGWSGNHKYLIEEMSDNRSFIQMGELLLPEEMTLTPGQSYASPKMYATFSNTGLSQISQQFHAYVRSELLSDKARTRPRKIHYNTWEAIYFDHKIDTLFALANKAAALGAERFVLDDGWFPGRTDDSAGLGDWVVDRQRYPNGFTPLIDHISALGMEFGLWLEPEMVNPDSALYRKHPDWVLNNDPTDRLEYRKQLVLDLSRPEVSQYLFQCISKLLTEYRITYLKWDMNRDLSQPGGQAHQASVHRQTKALYALLHKLKTAFPDVEIESCASGGGRADFGILQFTDRIWTSDSNDAVDRINIQRGFSFFFPPEVMGSHVGPRNCHITARKLDINKRAATAMLGHMGIEMNPEELSSTESKELQAACALYKKHRSLIHSGELFRLPDNGETSAQGIISVDKSEAIFSVAFLGEGNMAIQQAIKFSGLDPNREYAITRLWPSEIVDPHWIEHNVDNLDSNPFYGELLHNVGLQLPQVTPETVIILHLQDTEQESPV